MADTDRNADNDFARGAEGPQTSIFAEFLDYLKQNKKWWLLPILLVLLIIGVLVVLSTTAAGPFIYTLF